MTTAHVSVQFLISSKLKYCSLILEGNSRLHGDQLPETFKKGAALYVPNNSSQRLRNFKTPSKDTSRHILRGMRFVCGGADVDNLDHLPLKVSNINNEPLMHLKSIAVQRLKLTEDTNQSGHFKDSGARDSDDRERSVEKRNLRTAVGQAAHRSLRKN